MCWVKHRHILSRGDNGWEDLQIVGGAPPIEASEGWLMF